MVSITSDRALIDLGEFCVRVAMPYSSEQFICHVSIYRPRFTPTLHQPSSMR